LAADVESDEIYRRSMVHVNRIDTDRYRKYC
jgi:hypothetical protein